MRRSSSVLGVTLARTKGADMPVLNVTGTFTIVSDDVVGFAPDRNAPAGVPRQLLASAFTN